MALKVSDRGGRGHVRPAGPAGRGVPGGACRSVYGMQYTHLGRSGVAVSRLCLGTMNFGAHSPR
jgi:hypothetical protein